MAYSETLAARVREALSHSTGISERRMFGGLAFLKHGHMFVGINGNELMARVGKASHAEALARPHVREMDFTGRPMVGYVFVGAKGLDAPGDLRYWLRHCEQFVMSLPPKVQA